MTETFDGVKVLSNISSVPEDKIKEMWEDARKNYALLQGCPAHRFEGPRPRSIRDRLLCSKCGGRMEQSSVMTYLDGYEAAGGDRSDVVPDWEE